MLTYTLVAIVWLGRLLPSQPKGSGTASTADDAVPLLADWQRLYLWGLLAVEGSSSLLHPLLLGPDCLPFLPLMATSLYCRSV